MRPLSRTRRTVIAAALIIVGATAFRISVAHWFPNDAPDDGRIYAQIARNVLEQHVYSHETEPPYDPSYIRLPGYPLFVAAVYSLFGHGNNGAVRIAQALIDTGTCALVALLAFYWQPDEKRKRVTAIAALALAAVCPFTTIYAVTILTEVPTNLFVVATCLAATLAFRKSFTTKDTEGPSLGKNFKLELFWWSIAGLLGGAAVLLRPDCGLFVAAIGFTLVIATIWSAVASGARHRFGSSSDKLQFVADQNSKAPQSENDKLKFIEHPKRIAATLRPAHSVSRGLVAGAVFSIAFALALTPWTIRNWRAFHLFQPLAPVNAEMPGEFIPHGYLRWVKTWLDDSRYIDVAVWEVGIQPIAIDDLPDSAFDSDDERNRVEALLEQYNHPPQEQASDDKEQSQPQASPTPTLQASPKQTPVTNQILASKATPIPRSQTRPDANDNANNAKSDQTEDSSDQEDENNNSDEDQSDESKPEEHGPVAMTPPIDAAFGQLAAERIARHPLRYYLWMPAKRAAALWFNTHSDYYPFEGTLLPLEDLDHDTHQHIWLPLFAVLVGIYTFAGLAGALVLWLSGDFLSRSWVLLVFLMVITRLGFFSSLENPEPRYVVEFFPFLAALGGIAFARIWKRSRPREKDQTSD